MDDADGPTVAKSVYEELFKGDTFDASSVAYALDDAIQSLRQAGVAPHRWATYIHMGA